jgi:hypothetical protein
MQANAADLYADGTLTIGTGNPAYKPWYGGKSVEGSEWKAGQYTGDPNSGEGYEGAFAYALAQELGFTQDQVSWLGIPFSKTFAPGPRTRLRDAADLLLRQTGRGGGLQRRLFRCEPGAHRE